MRACVVCVCVCVRVCACVCVCVRACARARGWLIGVWVPEMAALAVHVEYRE